ncbi:MAG: ABC transporter ATP-binding protein/permease [Clostridiales bacterium]|nr:ABC transporter ATP-binding protein/permease [Clostridiales bacterium]
MIKTLSRCVRQYRTHSILSAVFVSLEVLMECIIPLYMARIIDLGIEKADLPYVVRTGLLLIGMACLSLTFGVLSGRSAAIASAGFARNLRHDLFYRAQDFSFSNIDHFSTASLVTRMTTDVTNLQNAYMMIIRVAVRSPVMLIFSVAMAFSIHRQLAGYFLLTVPVLGIGLYFIMSRAYPIFNRVFALYDRLNSVVQENLRGIRVVKSFVREDHEREKFNSVSEDIYDSFSRAERLLSFNSPLMMLCMQTCVLCVAWFGAKIIVYSGGTALTTGLLTSLITYAVQMLICLMMLSMVFVMITISRASAKRICEVLNEKIDLADAEDPVTDVPDGSIRFDNVSFSYAGSMDKCCLFHIDLDIRAGETVGILGGTGDSKSTLVQLIPRLYDVTEGSVSVGGVDVRRYDLHALRHAVSMVLQKNELFSGTIRDNLRWGNEDATDEELREVCRLAQADGFISAFPDGYDTWIEQGGTNVSGGQKQRLCIARALLKKPKVLIFDDSTSAVDTRTDALIRQGLQQYLPGATKLVIAQRVSSVQHADKIVILHNGRIQAVGTHESLLRDNEIYRELCYSQQKGGAGHEN